MCQTGNAIKFKSSKMMSTTQVCRRIRLCTRISLGVFVQISQKRRAFKGNPNKGMRLQFQTLKFVKSIFSEIKGQQRLKYYSKINLTELSKRHIPLFIKFSQIIFHLITIFSRDLNNPRQSFLTNRLTWKFV
jgi:hypothetical protein